MTGPRVPVSQISGLVLAGGQATRMNGIDKGLIDLAQRPMIAWVLERLRPQVTRVLISANRHIDQYENFGHAVLPDTPTDFRGPLAGIATALQTINTPLLAVVPCDAPRLPTDLVARLYTTLVTENADISAAHDGERLQSVCALLKRDVLADLLIYLNAGERRVDRWYARHRVAIASFADQPNAFVNINDPITRAHVEHQLINPAVCQ